MKMIKGIIIAILLSVVFIGCTKRGYPVIPNDSKADFEVEYLFECDGVKMYRFYDNGLYRYFTTGNGKMADSSEYSGKHYEDETVIQ
jgi:hypothetical protein